MITFCVKPKVFLFIMQNLKQKFVGFLFRQLLCIFRIFSLNILNAQKNVEK